MADLVIRGMRIPPQCVLYDEYRVYYKCPFADEGKWGVLVCTCPNQKRGARIVNEYTETRHPDCPLVPLPEGHGELIEKAEAYDRIMEQEGGNYIDMDSVGKGLEECQIFVPAEGGNIDGN